MAMSTSCSSNFLRGSYQPVSTTIGGKIGATTTTHLLAREVAPVLDVGDGKSVSGVWVRHVGIGGIRYVRKKKVKGNIQQKRWWSAATARF